MEVTLRMDSEHIKDCDYYIELAFMDVQKFLLTKNKVYLDNIIKHKVGVNSIHAPHFKIIDKDIKEICLKLRVLARELLVNNIVIHPSFGNLKNKDIIKNIQMVKNFLEEFNICIEKFTSKRRWVSTLEEFKHINKEYGFKCCYDFSHVPGGNEETIVDYLDFTPIIHVSNRRGDNIQHQRIIDTSCNLDYTKIIRLLKSNNWAGELVLEYMPDLHKYLMEDAQWLEREVYE